MTLLVCVIVIVHAVLALTWLTSAQEASPDLVFLAYNSYEDPSDTLVFGSLQEHTETNDEVSTINVGRGQHLWVLDEKGAEYKRGWMFRLRLIIQAVIDEYNRRGQQDFIAVASDAADVYVSQSQDKSTHLVLKDRFLKNFKGAKIVFSAQIYCCNPWELHKVGRRSWDALYDARDIPSMYKHLNAGLFMGYASSIIKMAEEMELWSKDYHPPEAFWSLVDTKAASSLRMGDLEVDDDEWQLATWFFEDQEKSQPLSTLDFRQDLFAVTGTFRVQQREEGFFVFSKNHFSGMFGPFPDSFDPDSDYSQLAVCPYGYHLADHTWYNTVTGGSPLVFHFAGNDWLCACTVFAAEGYKNIPDKFRWNCEQEYEKWHDNVLEGLALVANHKSKDKSLWIDGATHGISAETLAVNTGNSSIETQRHLLAEDRQLEDYGDSRRLHRMGSDRDSDDGPYFGDNRHPKHQGEDHDDDDDDDSDDGPYHGVYRRLRRKGKDRGHGDRDGGPYHSDDRRLHNNRRQYCDDDDDGVGGPYFSPYHDGDRRLRCGGGHRGGDDSDENPYGK